MEIKASLNDLRTSAQKVRLVADVIRTMPTKKALDQLQFLNKKPGDPIAKLINSAIANAVNNFGLDKDNLFIKSIMVNEGKTLKRWMPKAHGRATVVRKRACHIILVLGEIKESGIKTAKKQKIDEPVKMENLVGASEAPVVKKPKAPSKKVKESEVVEAEIIDPRMEGRHGHAKIEGGSSKGFAGKMFRRKSG
jgi:large subunit ribosomal protein L22